MPIKKIKTFNETNNGVLSQVVYIPIDECYLVLEQSKINSNPIFCFYQYKY